MLLEFKQAAVFGSELAPLESFMTDMRVQYQTLLGLGAPFPKDAGRRTKRSGLQQGRGRRRFWSRYSTPEVAHYSGTSTNDKRIAFLLLREGGGKSLTSLLCGIRVSVLLTRMGIVTEDAPAGTDIRALKCECPKIVGVKIPF